MYFNSAQSLEILVYGQLLSVADLKLYLPPTCLKYIFVWPCTYKSIDITILSVFETNVSNWYTHNRYRKPSFVLMSEFKVNEIRNILGS